MLIRCCKTCHGFSFNQPALPVDTQLHLKLAVRRTAAASRWDRSSSNVGHSSVRISVSVATEVGDGRRTVLRVICKTDSKKDTTMTVKSNYRRLTTLSFAAAACSL